MNVLARVAWVAMSYCWVAPVLAADTDACSNCAIWNVSQSPFRIYGNTYYVGTHGLSSILITSTNGHVLIDGALPESATKISASIRELGYRIEDVKIILNSHVHSDHAGGIAELQRMSGARVLVSANSAPVLQTGQAGRDDPQYGESRPIQAVKNVAVIKDGEVVRVGELALTAHLTPGHTSGGTSWSWQSCEQTRCVNMVYADSLTAVSADGFLYTNNRAYPNALQDFEKSFATLSAIPCDVLLTPHPEMSGFWKKLEQNQKSSAKNSFIGVDACKSYAAAARAGFAKRVAAEKAGSATTNTE